MTLFRALRHVALYGDELYLAIDLRFVRPMVIRLW
jgi:hypothetical protein